jgi:hypothetical protein
MSDSNIKIMEEIIGILVVIVLGIVKIIDKKFSSASGKPSPMAETQEAFPEIEVETPARPVSRHERMQQEYRGPEQMQPAQKAAEHFAGQPAVKQVHKPVARPAYKPVVSKSVQKSASKSFLEEDVKKTKEKIDPKKLIVYSEIMNRKY